MAGRNRSWSRPELLVVLRLYLQTDFGRLHQGNPDIRMLASRIGRTPSAVAMKAGNFASLDSKITSTGRTGLPGASAADREVWAFMQHSLESFEEQSARAERQFVDSSADAADSQDPEGDFVLPSPEQTEALGSVTQRRKQQFFRRTVLAAYGGACAISGIAIPELLNASHIIPWKTDVTRRLDPTNGIALNALYDRAFDRGLITVDEGMRIKVSRRLTARSTSGNQNTLFDQIAGQAIRLPTRFKPDGHALAYHRTWVFIR